MWLVPRTLKSKHVHTIQLVYKTVTPFLILIGGKDFVLVAADSQKSLLLMVQLSFLLLCFVHFCCLDVDPFCTEGPLFGMRFFFQCLIARICWLLIFLATSTNQVFYWKTFIFQDVS